MRALIISVSQWRFYNKLGVHWLKSLHASLPPRNAVKFTNNERCSRPSKTRRYEPSRRSQERRASRSGLLRIWQMTEAAHGWRLTSIAAVFFVVVNWLIFILVASAPRLLRHRGTAAQSVLTTQAPSLLILISFSSDLRSGRMHVRHAD